ncbi:MAG: hypothetical protein ACJ8LI_12605 [Chthoniobacterales bacterium]
MKAPRANADALQRLLDAGEKHLEDFLRLTASVSHEHKGIRRSEMFFLYASVVDRKFSRIIESGRARAQSTLVLAKLFPATTIISIESDAASPDVAIAAERLKDCANVECRFGDSRVLLPQLVARDDVVLIDGPKDFRAVKLALQLLRSGKPAAVFVHDLWLGSPARSFVDRSLRSALLSDHPEWVRRYCHLDGGERFVPDSLGAQPFAYGATMGRFEPIGDDYGRRLFESTIAQALARVRDNVAKITGRTPRRRPKDFEAVGAD